VIYISTTGVYGDSAGDWADEDSPCEPTRPGGKASLVAEEALRRHRLGARGIVLRLAGIYGPGRIPNQAPLLAGEPLAVPTAGFLNLIHVADAAATVLAAATVEAELPRTYLISDGHPVRRGEYYAELARLLRAPVPRFVEPSAGDPRAARAAADKRIDNSRMLAELRISLAYPSYREGLAAIVAGGQDY
jgi:nucleoside-diphosphate-sugar epimerase